MRDFKGVKRQRNRNRNTGGGGGGGGNKPQHNTNRAFDSNGPEGVKVRGAAQHVYEKYQQLARDAQTVGDRVLAENYLQHAEHYFRLMRAMQPLRPLSEIIGRDQFVSGYDIDFEDESGGEAGEADSFQETPEPVEQPRQESRQSDYQRDNRPRDEAPRQDRYQGDRNQGDRGQNDRNQNDRVQNDRPQNDRGQGDRQQNDRYQGDRPRNDRPREDRNNRPYRDERPRYDRDERVQPVVERTEAEITYPTPPSPMPMPEPVPAPIDTGVLRADDGDVSAAPAFLQVRPADSGEEPRRPRRRRAPASFEPASDGAATPAADD